MTKITFITGNEAKLRQLKQHLSIDVDYTKLDLPEIQSLNLEEIVKDKAERAFAFLRGPVLVEDVSLKYTHRRIFRDR